MIEAMGKASDAEKERCHAALEKAQSDLKISKEKQKDMAAELRFYQDKETREEEALEESTKASAQSVAQAPGRGRRRRSNLNESFVR